MSGLTISARWFQNKDIIYPVCVSSDGALVTIPYNTEATHNGDFYFGGVYNAAVAAGSNLDILLVTHSTNYCHFAFDANSGGAGTLSLYEGVTYSAAGSAVSAFNANRNISRASSQTITTGPTITGTGTTIITDYVPGGTTGNAVGGSSQNIARITEFISKPSTAYLIRFNNLTASSQPVSLTIGYFEGPIT